MSLLTGQTAIITGAAQGLGRAVALEFGGEGAAVALLDRNAESLQQVRNEIEAKGRLARAYPLDLTDHAAYARTVDEILAWRGAIDILVNNAAIVTFGTILDDTLENWRRTLAVNLEAVYLGCKLVAPHMVRRQSGRIISIASIEALAASGGVGPYNAAKGAIVSYTKSLAVELAPHNVLANAVAPGYMRTPMSIIDGVDETTRPDFVEWYINKGKIPLRRAGLPEDVAGTVIFLASGYCRYMTGQTLVVDGGLTSTF